MMTKSTQWMRLCFVFVLVLSQVAVQAQSSYSRKIEKSFDGKAIVEFAQSHGKLIVKKSPDSKVSWVTDISVRAKSEADAQLLFDNIKMDISDFSDRLRVDNSLKNITNWQEGPGGTNITLRNGGKRKIKGLKDFKMETVLYVPTTRELSLENQFSDILVANDVDLNDLNLKLYHADFEGENVAGNLEIKNQFGSAKLNEVAGEAELELYHGRLEMEKAGAVELKSQFSKIQISQVADLDITAYHDQIKTGKVQGDIFMKGQFTNLECKEAGNLELDCYHGKVEIESIHSNFKKIDVDGQFTNFTFDLPSATFMINANLNFGSLSSSGDLNFIKLEEKHHQKNYIIKSGDATDSSPKINIETYHGSVKLN